MFSAIQTLLTQVGPPRHVASACCMALVSCQSCFLNPLCMFAAMDNRPDMHHHCQPKTPSRRLHVKHANAACCPSCASSEPLFVLSHGNPCMMSCAGTQDRISASTAPTPTNRVCNSCSNLSRLCHGACMPCIHTAPHFTTAWQSLKQLPQRWSRNTKVSPTSVATY